MHIHDRIDSLGRHPSGARLRLHGHERAIARLRGSECELAAAG